MLCYISKICFLIFYFCVVFICMCVYMYVCMYVCILEKCALATNDHMMINLL